MIIQAAPAGEKRFVSTMVEHLELCEQFINAFGNDAFERPEPYEEFIYTVVHHDRGWDETDANPVLHAESGFPCGLGTGPVPGVLDTSRRSPDFNQAEHPYCGLLSSMHSWGLYNERYGVSEFTVLGGGKSVPIPPENEQFVTGLLDDEIARQQRLKSELAASPETASWVEEKSLMRNYKLLQFFDTLALYFNLRHESQRMEEQFVHIPISVEADATVTVRPIGDGKYEVFPFPFAGDELEVRCKGRYFEQISANDEPDDLAGFLYSLPVTEQVFTFVAGAPNAVI
ncbi:MAG TPA: hypothetical protein DCY55_00905 [Gammaproteobacteria bacterium]|jgi:hypothetical protein|nr:hypothetical protein [Gammaproteobacteria bacterium]